MLFRKSVLAAILLLCSNWAIALPQQKVNIEAVTVFLNGAEMYSKTRASIPAGESELLLTNVAGNVNQRSLSIGASNGVVIQSATFQNNYLRDEDLSPRAREIKDSIEYLEKKRTGTNNKLAAVSEQVTIIQQNRNVSGANTGLSTTELIKMLDLVNARMTKLLDEKDALALDIKKTNELISKLNQQLQEEKRKGYQPGGQLLVKLYSQRATNSEINLSYVVNNAGWTPSYDLRVDKVGGPVQLFYKAQVYQNSGVSWDKVQLTLSTGNPNEGAQAPVLNPWYLAFYTPRPIAYENKRSMAYTGDAEEIQKDSYAGGSKVASAPRQSTLNNYVRTDNSGVNTMFDIDIPYTIASDGQQHNVAIKSAELPATYRYYAVPKMDRDAFLQAQVTGWEDLDLLPAATNIFYEGTYVGQGHIDVRNVKDTMNLSLGRDKKIVVRRERDKELRSKKTIGTNVKEEFVYKISVRNTRNTPIDIVVLDQIPVRNDNSIEVEDKNYKGGDYDERTGEVAWKLKVKANETKELKVGFTVKYPKNKQLNL